MKVNVAGAGAGKTTKMADVITEFVIPDGKIVFCIAFSNAAVENIRKKVILKVGSIPDNIRISTIHSFLYKEFINPYYCFLFGKHFERLSAINLPDNILYRQAKLSELENDNILHYSTIPEKAKWIVYKKTDDTKKIKATRKEILKRFSNYCAAIFVDEAQDINEDVKNILESLDAIDINIILYGDPKQDVKGLEQFRAIINETNEVNYIPDCYRCPQIHLNLSNILAPDSEKQIANKNNSKGIITVVFESDVNNVSCFIKEGNYGLQYISMKRKRFATHILNKKSNRFETLYHEVTMAMGEKWKERKSELEINRAAFFISEKMLEALDNGSEGTDIISGWIDRGAFDKLSKKRYAQMKSVFQTKVAEPTASIIVRSIESVKGLEDKKCLFVLTTDLAPYMFQTKHDENKTSHLLYVALTRSLDNLTIMVTKEVEKKYTREWIEEYFNTFVE